MTLATSSPLIETPPRTEKTTDPSLARLCEGASIYAGGVIYCKAVQLLVQILLARLLGVAGYGLYSLGYSATILLQSAASMGLDNGVLRYCATYRNRGRAGEVKGTLLAGLALGFVSSLVVSGLTAVTSQAVSVHIFANPALGTVLRLFAVSLPFYILMRITSSFVQSYHNIYKMTMIQQVVHPTLNLLFITGMVFAGWRLAGAVGAFVAATALSAGLGLYYVHEVFPEFFSSLRPCFEVRPLIRFSLVLALTAVIYQLVWRAPNLLLGYLADTREVGVYNAAAALSSPAGFISLVFAQPFLPTMVDLYEHGKLRELGSLYHTVTRWTCIAVIPVFGVLVLFRGEIMALFGRDFHRGGVILLSLSLAWLIYYAKGPVQALLQMTGRQNLDLINLVCVLLITVLLGWWLIPRHGAAGAGLAISLSIVLWAIAEYAEAWILYKILPWRKDFAKQVLVAVAAFGTGFLLQTRLPGLIVAAVTFGLYVLLFAAFCVAKEDREFLRVGREWLREMKVHPTSAQGRLPGHRSTMA